ncbi:MAG: FecR family protein, partial [Candidatus Desulfobacillus denitrificans]
MILNLLHRLTAVALLATALPVLADAGAFQFVAGDVKIIRPDGREMVAAKGARIEEGDTVVTGANGHAQLLMADQALISLRPDSRLRFDAYQFAGKEDGSEKGILGLLKGGFRTLTGLIGRANKSNYQVRTPTATIGIRGTDHEPFHIPPEGWSGAPGADPGTYNRVNAGATYLQTEGGRIEIGVNQVGFVPPNPQAVPTRLDRVPDFMRPPGVLRGQGERRGP